MVVGSSFSWRVTGDAGTEPEGEEEDKERVVEQREEEDDDAEAEKEGTGEVVAIVEEDEFGTVMIGERSSLLQLPHPFSHWFFLSSKYQRQVRARS